MITQQWTAGWRAQCSRSDPLVTTAYTHLPLVCLLRVQRPFSLQCFPVYDDDDLQQEIILPNISNGSYKN